jgi:Glycosyl transferase family 11
MESGATTKMLKPVTVQLVGGLGNQLFGYFAGRYVAKRLGTELLLDVSQFDKGITAHGSTIASFKVSERAVNLNQETRFPVLVAQNALNFVANKLPRLTDLVESITGIHTSKPIGIDPRIHAVKPGMLMRGYYQTYLYVQDAISKASQDHLVLAKPSDWYVRLSAEAKAAKPIMVHVRRGDYAKPANKDFGMLDATFYKKAVDQIRHVSGIIDAPIWVFSDELDLAKTELVKLLPQARYIDPPNEASAAESMLLMSLGSANVISNSTFSWWSAILNPEAIVVAPSKWFKAMPDPEGLIPPSWLIGTSVWK